MSANINKQCASRQVVYLDHDVMISIDTRIVIAKGVHIRARSTSVLSFKCMQGVLKTGANPGQSLTRLGVNRQEIVRI